jgi:hypothetical protein
MSEATRVEMVYCGRRLAEDGNLYHTWLPLAAVEVVAGVASFDDGDLRWFRQSLVGCKPGAMYRFVAQDDTVLLDDLEYLGFFSDGDAVLQWQVLSHMAVQEYRAQRSLHQDLVAVLLEPLRQLYHQTPGREAKAQLLGLVVSHITRPYGGLPVKPDEERKEG